MKDQNHFKIQERDRELESLQEELMDVNSILKDLGELVNEQQSLLDNFEENVNETSVNFDNATVEISRAGRYQAKIYKRKCWMVVLIFVVFAILIMSI